MVAQMISGALWYARRKERGLCVACPKPVSEGHVRCEECRRDARETARLPENRAKLKRSTAKWRAQKIAEGKCSNCGKRDAIEGRKLCPHCLKPRVEYNRKRNQKQREPKPPVQPQVKTLPKPMHKVDNATRIDRMMALMERASRLRVSL